ncbi:MAG: YqaA family protein [Halobacteriota archaeon]
MSATSSVLPIPTEPTIALLLSKNASALIILLVLIPGSVIGASVGYLLGRYGVRRVIPFHNREREQRVREWFQKYGLALLLVSPWLPFVGDLVPIAAGFEKYSPSLFLVAITIAKAIKGTAIVYFIAFFLPLTGLHL